MSGDSIIRPYLGLSGAGGTHAVLTNRNSIPECWRLRIPSSDSHPTACVVVDHVCRTHWLTSRMWAGVVRQHPPMTLAPFSYHSCDCRPNVSHEASPCQVFVAALNCSPELGYTMIGLLVIRLISPISDERWSGDVQLMPTAAAWGRVSRKQAPSATSSPLLMCSPSCAVKLNHAEVSGNSASSRIRTRASIRQGSVSHASRSAPAAMRASTRGR